MIETEDLLLRKAVMDDWRDMLRNLWSHAESAKYMFWEPTYTEDEAVDRMRRTIAFEEKNPYAYLVCEKRTNTAIGFAGMEKIADGVYAETGIALGPAFTGKGYGKQVLNALVNKAFTELDAEKFVACCRSENAVSRALQLACGFSFSHTEERTLPDGGEKFFLEFYERQR